MSDITVPPPFVSNIQSCLICRLRVGCENVQCHFVGICVELKPFLSGFCNTPQITLLHLCYYLSKTYPM